MQISFLFKKNTGLNLNDYYLFNHNLRVFLFHIGVSCVLNTFMPYILVSFFNNQIINLIKQREAELSRITARQARELTVTRTLTIIVIFFVISHFPKFLMNMFESFVIFRGKERRLVRIPLVVFLTSFSNIMITLACSSNVFIYLKKDRRFRSELWKIFRFPENNMNTLQETQETAL